MPSFPVLFVCLGNVCRSPFAERLLRLRLAERGVASRFAVTSAGLIANPGAAMNPQSAAGLTSLGGDPAGFASRQFDEATGSAAGLTLTATKPIRSRALQEAPAALRRTFTILEFAALVADAPAGLTPQALVRQCSERRSVASVWEYDVPDPIGGTPELFAEVALLLDHAVSAIGEALAVTVD